MRSIWAGAIGFGLVNIPIKLYSAAETSTLDLDMLDKRDHSHIRFMRLNEHSGKEVSRENIAKGYKLGHFHERTYPSYAFLFTTNDCIHAVVRGE